MNKNHELMIIEHYISMFNNAITRLLLYFSTDTITNLIWKSLKSVPKLFLMEN